MENSNETKKADLIAVNFRCLHDQNFQTHPWHAGHVSKIKPVDPRVSYAVRKRFKFFGHRAWCLVRSMEIDQYGPKIKLERWQRSSVVMYIKNELFFTTTIVSGTNKEA